MNYLTFYSIKELLYAIIFRGFLSEQTITKNQLENIIKILGLQDTSYDELKIKENDSGKIELFED